MTCPRAGASRHPYFVEATRGAVAKAWSSSGARRATRLVGRPRPGPVDASQTVFVASITPADTFVRSQLTFPCLLYPWKPVVGEKTSRRELFVHRGNIRGDQASDFRGARQIRGQSTFRAVLKGSPPYRGNIPAPHGRVTAAGTSKVPAQRADEGHQDEHREENPRTYFDGHGRQGEPGAEP